MDRVVDPGRLQGRFIGGNAGADPVVEAGIVEKELRLDLGGVLRLGLRPVIGDRRDQPRIVDGELVGHAAAPAETDGADLAGGVAATAQMIGRRDEIADRGRRIEFRDELRRRGLGGRRAAGGRKQIGRQRHEALDRQTPGDVLDVTVEPAVLVDHDEGGQLRRRGRGLDQIGLDLAALAGEGERRGNDARIRFGDDRRRRLARRDQRGDRGGRRGAAGKPGQLVHEAAPVERQVGVLVIEADHFLRDLRRVHGSSSAATSPSRSPL